MPANAFVRNWDNFPEPQPRHSFGPLDFYEPKDTLYGTQTIQTGANDAQLDLFTHRRQRCTRMLFSCYIVLLND